MIIIKRLYQFLKPYVGYLLLALMLMVSTVLLRMLTPWLTGYIIDTVFVERRFNLLPLLALSIVAVTVVRGTTAFGERYTMEIAAQKVIYDIRNAMYRHLQELSFSFYDKAQTGQLMSRTTSDVETLRNFLGRGTINLVSNGMTFFGVLIYLLYRNWQLTLVALAPIPLLIIVVIYFAKNVRPRFRRIREQQAELTSVLQENVSGVKVVRAFAQEEQEIEKFDKQNWLFLTRSIEAIRLWAFYFPLMEVISGLSTIAIIWFGGRQVIRGQMTLGTLVAFQQYMMMLIGPIRMLGWLVNLLTMAQAAGERIFEVLDTRPDIVDAPNAIEPQHIRGHVVFDNLSFAYEKDNLILKDINVEAQPGEIVAVLGSTGSGKSTLIYMVPRFYDPIGGCLKIDGYDIRDLTVKSLRSNIGLVLQETFLFSASIKDNIAYGRERATMDEIVGAAKAARAHDFIMGMPRGYDSRIGERGLGLSGGQKQRVAIARALLMDPRILILDEATSSVDTETEFLIQEALKRLMEGRTTFVIAQRLSTVKNADKIIVLDQGQIVQRGTHETLINEEGIYQEIYEMQFKGQETGLHSAVQTAVTVKEGDC